MLKEFREFVMRGNVLDMSVGIVVGGAFGALVRSFVDDVLMPPIGLLLGGLDFANFFVVLKSGGTPGPYATVAAAKTAGAVTMNYGLFMNGLIGLLIVASAVFLLVRSVNAMHKRRDVSPAAPTTKECQYCASTIPIRATRCPQCTSQLAA